MRYSLSFCGALASLLLLAFAPFSTAAPDTYSNPVLAGDYPDPSVIRVGNDYWATATTSEWGPIFPLLRSRDLVHWEQIGSVFQKRPAWAVANFWAPELSEYRGKFYIYYVGRQKGGPLTIAVATADRPEGPWTDHGPLISQPAGSIDADTAIDESGQRYLIWKEDGNSRNQPTPIWAQKLSEDGTKLLGEMTELLRNDGAWEKNVVEGPFVLRRGGHFYMFYSGNGCCGAGCSYALGVARAKKLLGPWEKNPANPILAANQSWRCPGHGSVVSTPEGRDLLLYHSYHSQTFIYVGRQGLLDEVKWGGDGWPTINQGHGPSVRAPLPVPRADLNEQTRFFDDFDSPTLGTDWQWPVNNEPQTKIANGILTLRPAPEHSKDILGAVLGIQTKSSDYEATTLVDLKSLDPGESAGISAFGDRANALGLSAGDGKVTVWRRQKNKHEAIATLAVPKSNSLQLRLTAKSAHKFRFSMSTQGNNWTPVGPDLDLEGNYLPPWDRGVRVALVAGGAENTSVNFDWLLVTR